MGLFYKASNKEILEIRNNIFIEKGLPTLYENGFIRAPFSTSLFGRNNLQDFSYQLCRLSGNSYLDAITVHISRGDRWIKIFLNVFELQPILESLEPLKKTDGMLFNLPPNSISNMRLRMDDIKGMPLFRMLFGKEHKICSYYSKAGLKTEVAKLNELIEKDMTDINRFVKRWHELHRPNLTDWNGHVITNAN